MANLSLFSLFAFVFVFSLLYNVRAFSFTHNTPTSCDDLSISWTGGTAPFFLTLIPVFGTPRNISIPSSAFSDGKGSFSTQLPFAEGSKMLIAMSDQTGYGTGGDTPVLVVGPSQGGSCNTDGPRAPFTFELNSALQQCRTFTFSNYNGAVQPVTIVASVPGGETLVLNPPVGPNSFDWTVNVFNGTSLIFMMFDSQGRQGGSSDVRVVGISDDSSCINGDSPTSTIASTSTPSSTSSSEPSQTSSVSNKPSTPIGAIAGTVVGALVFLAVAITLGLFFLRRRQYRDHPEQRVQRYSRRMHSSVDLLAASSEPHTYSPYSGGVTPTVNTPTTQMFSPAVNTPATQTFSPVVGSQGSQYSYPVDSDMYSRSSVANRPGAPPSTVPSDPTEHIPKIIPFFVQDSRSSQQSSPSQKKAAMAGVSNYKPSRFILHTDAEDVLEEETREEVIELPPQYSERRVPQPQPQPSGSGSQWAGASTAGSTFPGDTKQHFS